MYRPKTLSPLEVQITRGNFTESVHFVDAVVVDADGMPVAVYGNPERMTFPRSAIKMIQAFLLLESGALEKYSLSQIEIALACASHKGEDIHVSAVRDWLLRLGLKEHNLICGAHLPSDEESAFALIRNNVRPCRFHNNCSGKHSGILSSILAANQDIQNYGNYEHWVQIRLRKLLGNLSQANLEKSPWGVDGCGIPSYAMPLAGMAKAMSSLLQKNKSQEFNLAAKIICDAVAAHPYFIAGRNSFCTEATEITRGKSIIKGGAEGVYCGVLREQGFAFSLKVNDGAARASEAAAGAILQAFQGINTDEAMKLSRYTHPVIKNWSGLEVGKIIVRNPEIG